ncbi:MAG: hypothetical protein MUC87_13520 [Bacteroidia bacterium]|jgi:hypothetical protein|nr:hypothetical protein [Bacteroidia bacterium]
MRYLVLLLIFALPASLAAADYTAVYTIKNGSSSLRVLRLRSDKVYEYLTYTKKKATRDTGVYELNGRKLELKTTMKRHGPNPMLRKTFFVSTKGLYEKRSDVWFGRRPKMASAAGDASLTQHWLVNPLTRETFTGSGSSAVPQVKKPAPKATAAYVQPANAGDLAKKFYISVASRFAKGYDEVLTESYCGPDCYYHVINDSLVKPVIDTAEAALFSNFETVVHESVHMHNKGGYLIFPGIYIDVPRTAAYKTSLFTPVVPADARDNIFRYKTYVDSNSVVSANVSGIYGLLDEYSAYFNGVHSCLLGAKESLQKGDTARAQKFMSMASSTYNAHYEFRLFIAWYVHYASLKEKEAYNAMMNNTNLRVVFTLLDNEFRNTIAELDKLSKTKGLNSWNSFDVSYYSGAPSDNYLFNQLKKEEQWLSKLKIANVTTANYNQFIKAKK